MKKIINKELILNIIIPLGIGAIVGFLSNPSVYKEINRPLLSPPSIVFPIVWSILYIFLGIGNYKTKNTSKNYKIQLIINFIWPYLFFRLKWYFVALLWLLLLIFFVIRMLIDWKKKSKLAFYLNIPYLIWLLFATYLNIGVFLLN